jgi:hypothetical protein
MRVAEELRSVAMQQETILRLEWMVHLVSLDDLRPKLILRAVW